MAWTESQMSAHSNTAKIVWDFLKSKGLNNEACAAVLGNIERESHFDTGGIEGNGEGHGLIQWSYGRKTALLNYANSQGKNWTDINLQLDFMWSELTGSENATLKMLQKATNVKDATVMFEKLYERAGVIAKDERIKYAEYWFNQFKDTDINTSSYSGSGENGEESSENNYEEFYKYFNAGYLEIPDELSIAMMDELVKIDPLRRIDPLHKLDYIDYGHREYITSYNLSLGDSTFVIPPQAISIVSESNGQEIVTLRQENTQKIKHGYSKRIISIELVLHGYNQINGYQVEGPEGYYYVDGLRQLLAQFKCTPFLPIENTTINNTYNIYTVALQSIVCSTVDGFPDMIIANLTLQEVDLYPYIESHSMFFDSFIDWDLFRFYYQRQLTEKHEYGKLQSIPIDKQLNKFKISILNETIFDTNADYKIDYDTDKILWWENGNKNSFSNYNLKGMDSYYSFYDIVLDRKIVYINDNNELKVVNPSEEHPSNFETYIDSEKDNVHISSFQCGYSNILTNIQMAEHSHPTVQYMGGMDTMFNITFETTNEDVVTALEKCNIMNNMLTRNHKDCASLGFVKLESELVELFGSKFVMIDNVVTHTVPDFPGLFICQINCISFDIYQKEREGINGLSPFEGDGTDINGKGTKENAIKQSPAGLKEKVKQDLCVENKIRNITNLYPDLKLPTYQEVDEVITKIKSFRVTHTRKDGSALGLYPIDRYPRTPQRMLHGISEIANLDINNYGFVTNVPDIIDNSKWYEGYVDPDFYIFYPETYKKMMDETEEDRISAGSVYSNKVPKARTTTIKSTKYGAEEVIDSNISNYNYDLQSDGASSLQIQFIAKARDKIGKVYSNDNSGYYNRTGPNAYDCSGLIGKCLYEMGIVSNPKITTVDLIDKGICNEKWKVSSTDNINELIAHANPGDLLHIYGYERGTSMNHVAIYSGDGNIVHASSSKNQVCEVPAYKGFMRVLEIPALLENSETIQNVYFDEDEALEEAIKNNPDGKYITKSELEAIAKTVANIQLGKPYDSQVALAQLIYDRASDNNNKYGTITNILNSPIFKGQYSKDLPVNSTVYKAVENVFCNGERAFTKQVINYLGLDSGNAEYKNLESQYKQLGTIGDFTFWTNNKETLTDKYILIENPNNKSINNKTEKNDTLKTGVEKIDASFAKYFGKPVLVKTSEMNDEGYWFENLFKGKGAKEQDKIYKKNYNTDIQILMSSFVNQCEYSGKGRLVKAFPTYLFCIVDEDGNWLDGRKLWANYYLLRSLVDIQVVNYDDSPVSTATVTVTNSYGNLDTLPPNAFYYSPLTDSEYNDFQKFLYKWFAMLPGTGPKLTQTLVDQKNIIYDSMLIRAGCRMHLRMGYGSDPLSLPIVMNGYISDLQVGDITQFVCVSDGVELTNSVISARKKDKNNVFEGQESSNLCIEMLTSRQSPFLNAINSTWGEPNKYGIEHFGLYMSTHCDINEFFDVGNIHIPELKKLEIGDGFIANTIENIANTAGNIINTTTDIVDVVGNAAITTLESVLTGFRNILDNFYLFKEWKELQYDLIKNIYRSSYDGSLAMYRAFLGYFDGEINICFNLYNKTPWDVIQIAAMNAPEYIGMPLYHQFDSRLFFGLPWFLAKYRYNMINGELFEEAKTFAQCHFVDSLSEIIDNQMLTTSRNIYTNAIVMYTLGSSPKASPTLYSDKTINFSQQSTKIFDSSVTQDILGFDQLLEWIGIDFGKETACRVGTSQLLWNWAKAYQGDVIILGDAGINPCDYIYLNDRFNNITGLCTARVVTHSLSARTGFTTSITPGMIGMSTKQNSQALIVLTNIITVGGAFSYYMSVKKTIKDNADKVADWYGRCKEIVFWVDKIDFAAKLLLIGSTIKNAKTIYNGIKAIDKTTAIKEMKNIGSVLKNSFDTYKDLKKLGETAKIAKTIKVLDDGKDSVKTLFTIGKGIFKGISKFNLVGFIVLTFIERLLDKLVEFLEWNNVLVLLPLMHENIPYAPILSGEKLLLTGSSNVSEDTLIGKITTDSDGEELEK